MHAVRVHEFGDASKLIFEEVPIPDPKPGEVRVKLHAVGLNFTEISRRKGLYPAARPVTLGAEFAGSVDALGEGVTGFSVGDRVATAHGIGGYAEYAIAEAWRLIAIPDKITSEQAAGVLLQGMTAHYLTYSTYPLKAGDTALVHAAAGGVGLMLVQIAKRRGALVIGTVSTEEKVQIARNAGADYTIVYTAVDFEDEVHRLTNGQKASVVYDSVGKMTFMKGLNCLRPRGYMILFGQSSGPIDVFDSQILNQKGSLLLARPSFRDHTSTREEILARAGDLFAWVASETLTLRIDRTFPLSQAAEAHRYMEARQTKGKVLLRPWQ